MIKEVRHDGFKVKIGPLYVTVEQVGKKFRPLNYAMLSRRGQKVALRYDVVEKRAK